MTIKESISLLRLRTLPLSASGVILGSCLAAADYKTSPLVAVFILLTALSLQIVSNISNDIGDFRNGVKSSRDDNNFVSLSEGQMSEKEIKTLLKIWIGITVANGLLMIYFSFGTLFCLDSFILMILGYFAINAAMRTDKTDTLDEDDKKTCDVLLKHCLNNQFDEKVLVVRNVSPGFLSQQFGVTLDGQELTDKLIKKSGDEACLKLEKDFQEAMIGKKILDKGFTSVSLVPHANVFNTRTIQFSIMVPAGTKAYVTNNLIESEAILAPGTSLNIKDVTYDTRKNKFIIYCMAEQNF